MIANNMAALQIDATSQDSALSPPTHPQHEVLQLKE